MQYRPLGRTGMYVSEICLGTMTFGGRGFHRAMGAVDQAGATAFVERALEHGVNFIDTADVYSEGEAERMLGQALKDAGVPRREVVIATKVRGRVGPGPNAIGLSRGHIMDAVEGSLQRLGTEYIDLYQIHGADLVTPIDETLRALDDLVARGLVRYIGCSNLAGWQIMKAIGVAERRGYIRFESVQAYYSIASRDLERDVIPVVQDQALGLMVWSPLAGGLLSGKFRRDQAGPDGARRTKFDFPPIDRDRAFAIIDAMRPIATSRGVSVARIALAWLLHQKPVTSIVIGAKTLDQLDDNLAASGTTLTTDELTALDRASALAPEYPGWMIERQHAGRVPPSPNRVEG